MKGDKYEEGYISGYNDAKKEIVDPIKNLIKNASYYCGYADKFGDFMDDLEEIIEKAAAKKRDKIKIKNFMRDGFELP